MVSMDLDLSTLGLGGLSISIISVEDLVLRGLASIGRAFCFSAIQPTPIHFLYYTSSDVKVSENLQLPGKCIL